MTVTPGSAELLAHEAAFDDLLREFLKRTATAKLGVLSSRANDLLHKLDHLAALRLAAKPAEDAKLASNVREATIKECAKVAKNYHPMLYAPEMDGRHPRDSAIKSTREDIERIILALSPTGAPKP